MKYKIEEFKLLIATSLVLSCAGVFAILQAIYLSDWFYLVLGFASFSVGWIIRSVNFQVENSLSEYSWRDGILFFKNVPIREGDHPLFDTIFWSDWLSIQEEESDE